VDFSFTEEQSMLRDTVAAYLGDHYDFDKRRAAVSREPGWRPAVWKAFAEELGILGAPFSEELGGLGGGPIENMVVMEEFGKALVVEPYLGTVVIGGGFLKHSGHAGAADLIGGIIGGETIFAFAQAEPQSRYNLAAVATTAKKDGAGWVLNGHKAVVIGAPFATHLIVTARTAGGERDAQGVSVFIVEKAAKGVTTRDYPTVDGNRASEVYFENVSLGADALLGPADHGLPLVEKVVDEAIAPPAPRPAACCASCTRARWSTPSSASSSACRSPASRCCSTGWSTCSSTSSRRVDDLHGQHQGRRRRRAAQGRLGRQGADRQGLPLRRPERHPAARRHGHDRRDGHRPLLQARHHDRERVRLGRPPPGPLRVPEPGRGA
jgi:hypothetical protein